MPEEVFIALVSAVHALAALVTAGLLYRCAARSECMREEQQEEEP